MIQQGQVFKLQARLQVGGFSSRAEAQRALQNKLAQLRPDRRAAALTLGEWVEEYLETHQGERVTVAKLRWLLGKATAELGGVRLAGLWPEQVCAWRLTVPEGHRFEASQALRQVLNRAVAWKLIDDHPAKRGVPNPGRRSREQRPSDSWAQIRSVAELLGPRFGPMIVIGPPPAARSRSPCSSANSSEGKDTAEQTRGAAAGDRARGARAPPATTWKPVLSGRGVRPRAPGR